MSDDPQLHRITGFHLVTPDPIRLAGFYRDALGFAAASPLARISDAELRALGLSGSGYRLTLRLGQQFLHLDRFDQPGQPYPAGGTAASPFFQHLALVVRGIGVAFRQLGMVAPISRGGPQILPASSGGVSAFKFRDPDGHPLELLEFPDALTPSAWQHARPHPRTGLVGIDHSAISVADPVASRDFYGRIGLSAEPGGRNQGPAQQRLDGLDGVSVAVVPLRPAAGTPHLELLGYEHPRPGTASWSPNDVAATRIAWAGSADAVLRDPDGHLHQVYGSAV